jgi:uridine phosphorylase
MLIVLWKLYKERYVMLRKEFPILEFDTDKDAFIRPHKFGVDRVEGIAERCVMCFFAEGIEKILTEYPHRYVGRIKMESAVVPIHEIEYKGERICLVQAFVGAPLAAGHIEEITALGCTKFIACGSCGVLEDMAVGHLIIPTSAVRDEGTSYHYIEPSREIEACPVIVSKIEEVLKEQNIPYVKGKTWTTDAIYRETVDKIKLRREEGCITVEMEAAAYIAVSKFLGVEFGQILYAGDTLAGEEWDKRDFSTRTDVREVALRAALDAALNM